MRPGGPSEGSGTSTQRVDPYDPATGAWWAAWGGWHTGFPVTLEEGQVPPAMAVP